jgi:hypothetical protein
LRIAVGSGGPLDELGEIIEEGELHRIFDGAILGQAAEWEAKQQAADSK